MTAFFLKLVNMSINASWVILVVLVARLLLRKAPKSVHCLLWALVAFRLVFSCSMESDMSLLPSAKTIEPQVLLSENPAIHSGIDKLDQVVNALLVDKVIYVPETNGNSLQPWIIEAVHVWLIGMIVLLGYSSLAYLCLKMKVRASIRYNMFNDMNDIRLCDRVESPFILGIQEPIIYLPSDLSKKTQEFVIAHELAHLKRCDHLWKPFGYLLLAIYWFNPLVWVSYVLFCRDIEMACDEQVVKMMNGKERKGYSGTLLSCSVPRHMITACPLAFGDTGVKQRVENVLHYKKPAFWIRLSVVIMIVFISACFLTNPKEELGVANNMWARKAAGYTTVVYPMEYNNFEYIKFGNVK